MTQKQTIKRVLKYIKSYRLYLAVSILLAVVTVALTLYIPVLVGNAIDCIVDKGKVDFNAIKPILIQIAAVAVSTAVAQWVMNICNNKITYNVSRDIRNRAIKKIEKLPLNYIDTHPSGDTVSRVIADVDQFSDGLLMGFTQLFTGVVTIVATLCFMLSLNLITTLVVVLITPLSLFVAKFIASKTYNMFKQQSEIRGEQTAFIEEMIENQKVVQAYTHEDENEENFDSINQRLGESSLKAVFFSSITNPSTRFVNNLVYAGVAFVGALMVINNSLTIGNLTCFLSYANQYTKPFNEISGVITELQNA
ncbi:MAG: ABC transporter ATP-binding protein, partial [Acutalibacteraceae bacterium]|nr:ABC transporter ATP-binding protein [Acutalibacteraceae bacterium]